MQSTAVIKFQLFCNLASGQFSGERVDLGLALTKVLKTCTWKIMHENVLYDPLRIVCKVFFCGLMSA